MNHKYSTIALISILLVFLIFQATAYLTSDEIDSGFNCSYGSVLYKDVSVWNCSATNYDNNISIGNLTIRQNSTTIIFDTGGKGGCIGNCSS